MAQSDNHPDPKTQQGRQHRRELAPHQSTVPNGQNAGKTPAAKNADTHPFPPFSTWYSAETLEMHCTVDDHRRLLCEPDFHEKPSSQEKSRTALRGSGATRSLAQRPYFPAVRLSMPSAATFQPSALPQTAR